MRKSDVSSPIMINYLNRKGIKPDWIHKVNQGYLRVWLVCNQFVAEVYIGSDNGESIPGTLQILAKYSYANTQSPQDIADDIILDSKLTRYDMEALSPSQMGKLGGSVKSEAKLAASRENGKKGGRPKKIKDEK